MGGAARAAQSVAVLVDEIGPRLIPEAGRPAPLRSNVPLSPREREIARLIARGLPNKAIGAVLGISTWTVATHLRRMFAKTGVTSRAAMVAALADTGQLIRDS
jgi:DNA-binding CsgD family transcriptional regulator